MRRTYLFTGGEGCFRDLAIDPFARRRIHPLCLPTLTPPTPRLSVVGCDWLTNFPYGWSRNM